MYNPSAIACLSHRVLTRERCPLLSQWKGSGFSKTSQAGLPWAAPFSRGRRREGTPESPDGDPENSPSSDLLGGCCRPQTRDQLALTWARQPHSLLWEGSLGRYFFQNQQ